MSQVTTDGVLRALERVNAAVTASGDGDPRIPVTLHTGIPNDMLMPLLKLVGRNVHSQMRQYPALCACDHAAAAYMTGILLGWYLAQETDDA